MAVYSLNYDSAIGTITNEVTLFLNNYCGEGNWTFVLQSFYLFMTDIEYKQIKKDFRKQFKNKAAYVLAPFSKLYDSYELNEDTNKWLKNNFPKYVSLSFTDYVKKTNR